MAEKQTESGEHLPLTSSKGIRSSGSTNDTSCNYSESCSDKDLVEDDLTFNQAQLWRRAALGIAWMCVIVLLIIGVFSFVLSATTDSSAAFGFGFGCILDVFTSIVVIWRFHGSVKTLYSDKRERIALLFLAGFFLVASFSIIVRTITELADLTHTKHEFTLRVVAGISGSLCLLLAVVKFIIASKLASKTVRSDGFSSLAGSVTAFSILISAQVISNHPNVWFLDHIVGFFVAALLMVYGMMLLVQVASTDCICHAKSGTCCCCRVVDSSNTTHEN